MSDEPTVAPSTEKTLPSPPAAAETFSAEYVQQLKKELEQKKADEALLRTKFAAHEDRQRKKLEEMQPVVEAWIEEGLQEAGEHRQECMPMKTFGSQLSEAANLESAMPLARIISCHSAKLKRERAEFSAASAASESLGKANAELDELKSDRDKKATRILELEGLVAERTEAASKMQAELAAAGLVSEKYNFSVATSREVAPPTNAGSSSSSTAPPAREPMVVDPLFAFVSKAGVGNGRILSSNTSHHMLGAAGSTGEADISTLLRFAQ